jgi:hypothetical protein
MTQFIAIGYYAIDYPDGNKKRMFKSSSNTPFDFLNCIRPDEYYTIADIEKKGNIKFSIIDKGGFYSPFYEYYCILGNMMLFVMGSPSDNKNSSYYMGGWSYGPKN